VRVQPDQDAAALAGSCPEQDAYYAAIVLGDCADRVVFGMYHSPAEKRLPTGKSYRRIA
jgi:hypothetical protein